jgi:hypothetical protein
MQSVAHAIHEALGSLTGTESAVLLRRRREKFLAMGHETIG